MKNHEFHFRLELNRHSDFHATLALLENFEFFDIFDHILCFFLPKFQTSKTSSLRFRHLLRGMTYIARQILSEYSHNCSYNFLNTEYHPFVDEFAHRARVFYLLLSVL